MTVHTGNYMWPAMHRIMRHGVTVISASPWLVTASVVRLREPCVSVLRGPGAESSPPTPVTLSCPSLMAASLGILATLHKTECLLC